jgi:hypothetical protein
MNQTFKLRATITPKTLGIKACWHLFSVGFQILDVDTMGKEILSYIVYKTCTSPHAADK